MTRRGAFSGLAVVLLIGLFLRGISLPAQTEENPIGPEAGQSLAAEMRSMHPEEKTNWHGILKIKRNHKTVSIPVACETSLDASSPDWTVTYLTAATNGIPAEKLMVKFSPDGPNHYFFARAASPDAPPGPLPELSGAAADIPLAGSDFWLSDLGMDFYHWPQQERLAGERHGGELCHVLESVNPHPSPGGYARVKTWIEKESGAPLEAIAYGTNGEPLKNFRIGSVQKVKRHWELKDIEMINIPAHSQTHIVFDLDGR